MNRINVYVYPADWDSASERKLEGWFDADRAVRWDDADFNGNGSGGTGRGQAVYRTAQGRWVLGHWTNWQNESDRHEFISDDKAREWLLRNDCDAAVTDHFGEIEEERGPGRPAIGDVVQVRFGDELLGMVDAYAGRRSISRAEAIRRLATDAVTRAMVAESGPLTQAVNR